MNNEPVYIPLVKNLSDDPADLLGHVKLDSNTARQIAALLGGGIDFRLSATLSRRSTELSFINVSFTPVPAKPADLTLTEKRSNAE